MLMHKTVETCKLENCKLQFSPKSLIQNGKRLYFYIACRFKNQKQSAFSGFIIFNILMSRPCQKWMQCKNIFPSFKKQFFDYVFEIVINIYWLSYVDKYFPGQLLQPLWNFIYKLWKSRIKNTKSARFVLEMK